MAAAGAVEGALFTRYHGRGPWHRLAPPGFTRQLRCLNSALRSNAELKRRILAGDPSVRPAAVVRMGPADLQSSELTAFKKSMKRKKMEEVKLAQSYLSPGGMRSSHFTCRECKGRDTTYRFTVTAGSLRHDPFGARKVLVCCLQCGVEWEHAGLLPN